MTKFVIDTEGVSELAVLLGNKIMNSEFEERKGTSGGRRVPFSKQRENEVYSRLIRPEC